MLTTRRALLAAASATLAAAPRPAWAQNLSRGMFTHGVASGDPLPDGVILWTRFVGANGGRVAWEIAEDEAFARVAQRGQATASFANDFCVKADVRGLLPNRRYFYRFLSGSEASPVGLTRTAPAQGGDALSIAVFSCSNFGFGYFHAYGHAATRDDIDLVIHTGDYIYEYGRTTYPNEADTVPGRIIDPSTEIVRLGDYYQRYAAYHADPDLQALRQAKPMATVWDDHELTNDTWRDGAQNHQDYEGTWSDRIAAASKAYFDWMPIRRPEPQGARIYRTLDWGDLARIVLLDTRYPGRDRQIDYRSALLPRLADGGADVAAVVAEFRRTLLDDPNRTLLGGAQERWFADALAQSKQRGQPWQIVAQQVILGEQMYAVGASRLLPESASSGTRQWIAGGEQLSSLGLPWNMDSWGGYPAARARFIDACVANANNAVVLAGDSHNCWLNNIAEPSGRRMAAIEFAGGSVTSPGFERSLSNAQPGEREALMRNANANLAWCDLSKRGYGALRFTRNACEADWVAFDDVRVPEAGIPSITRLVSEPSAAAGPSPWAPQHVDFRHPRSPT